jgi:hypothetical protein
MVQTPAYNDYLQLTQAFIVQKKDSKFANSLFSPKKYGSKTKINFSGPFHFMARAQCIRQGVHDRP